MNAHRPTLPGTGPRTVPRIGGGRSLCLDSLGMYCHDPALHSPYLVTVNLVAPGCMISENVPDDDSEGQRKYRANVPLIRRGYDQDFANLVAFLASDLAAFISGQYVSVSGGNVMPTI